MRITALDLQQQQFKVRFRGYDRQEVEGFLELVAQELEAQAKENQALQEKLRQLEAEITRHQEREHMLKNTLVTAQKVTEDLKDNAKKESQLVVKAAELKAEKILEQAHLRAAKIQEEIAELKRQRKLFEAKVRAAMRSHEELLNATVEEVDEDKVRYLPPREAKLEPKS